MEESNNEKNPFANISKDETDKLSDLEDTNSVDINSSIENKNQEIDFSNANLSFSDISDKEKEESKVVREKLEDGTKIIIQNVGLTPIKCYDEEGKLIPPSKSKTGGKSSWYDCKLKVEYTIEKDDIKRVEYYPSVKFFVNNFSGVKKLSRPVLPRQEFSKTIVARLRKLVCDTYNIESENLSDQKFMMLLSNSNAVIGRAPKFDDEDASPIRSGTYNGVKWFRNDIEKLIPKVKNK